MKKALGLCALVLVESLFGCGKKDASDEHHAAPPSNNYIVDNQGHLYNNRAVEVASGNCRLRADLSISRNSLYLIKSSGDSPRELVLLPRYVVENITALGVVNLSETPNDKVCVPYCIFEHNPFNPGNEEGHVAFEWRAGRDGAYSPPIVSSFNEPIEKFIEDMYGERSGEKIVEGFKDKSD